MVGESVLAAAVAGLVLGGVAWAISVRMKDTSIVDRFWGLLFVAGTVAAWLVTRTGSVAFYILAGAVTLWGVRLALYIHLRNRGHPEDRRYAAMRADHPDTWWWRSLITVFTLQAALMVLIGLPVWYMAGSGPHMMGPIFYAGLTVWAIGFTVETVADAQMARFKRDSGNKGQVLDQGLWGWSRHPNYFGESVLWWGIGIMAASQGGWWTLVGPLFITFMLLRVSGVSLLEKDLKERKPEYAEYVRTTSAFIPWPPRK